MEPRSNKPKRIRRKTKMIPYINADDILEFGRVGRALLVSYKSKFDPPGKAMDGFVLNSTRHAKLLLKTLVVFLKLNEDRESSASKMVAIDGVKWKRQAEDPQIYPAADTDQFAKLVGTNRGLLVFIPEDEMKPAWRDMFSDIKPEAEGEQGDGGARSVAQESRPVDGHESRG